MWCTSDFVHRIWAREAGTIGKAGTRRRRQVWVRLNHAGRILLSTGGESDIDADLSPLGQDLEDDRIGVVQEENALSHPGLNRTVGHVPRKERRRWNAILKDSRCGSIAPITECPPKPSGEEAEPVEEDGIEE